MKRVISTRLDMRLVAKARDGLLSKGIEPDNCSKVSQILRLTFLFGLTSICEDPTSAPSEESNSLIKQKISQKVPKIDLNLNDIIEKTTKS